MSSEETIHPEQPMPKPLLALREQPMAALGLFFGAGLLAGLRWEVPALAALAAAAAVWGAGALFYRLGRSAEVWLYLLAAALGFAAMNQAVPAWYRHAGGAGEYERVRGTVAEASAGAASVRLTLTGVSALEEGRWQAIDGGVSLTVYQTGDPEEALERYPAGSRVEGALELILPPVAQIPGGYDERLRAMARGIRFEAAAPAALLTVTPGETPWWTNAAGWAGERVRDAARRYIGGEEAGAVCALLTGDSGDLSAVTREGFSRLGIAHLLAVSGLHVGIVLLAVGALGRRFRWGAMTATLATAAVLAFYFLLTGPRPSVLRALMLWLVMTLGRWSGRRYSPLNSLGAVFCAILLVRPLDILDAGFQLSFLSAGGIILLYPALESRVVVPLKRSWRLSPVIRQAALYSLGLFLVTGCVYLAVWPWMADLFGFVAPAAFAANLLFVPLATIILMGALTFAALAAAWPPLAVPVAWLLRVTVRGWLALIRQAAAFAPVLRLSRPSAAVLVLSGALVLALSPAAVRCRVRWRVVTAGILAAAVVAAYIPWGRTGGGEASLRAVGDGSGVAVLVERDAGIPLLVLDRPVYYLADYWESRGMPGPSRILFLGTDADDLRAVAADETLMASADKLLVPQEMADDMAAVAEELGWSGGRWETYGEGWAYEESGVSCRTVAFSAKTPGSMRRYALYCTGGFGNCLYIDPRYLPETAEWCRGLRAVIVSRMTDARQDKLGLLDTRMVIYTDGGAPLTGVTVLDGSAPVLYNMNDQGSAMLAGGE